ncbi:MAG: 1-deoxy-D-xylulose-5-phosphate reductoisomerase [Phycisphaerae bacterium]|nr:1-deoxy-D-xylulose-5-phosphate reductoisomerase [Phycisphaerae bacterium]NUQ46425.1 1-deoxy-D-xylulose-5-phosphate reductoisomerase [Phycisphaerae bacterium]
MPKRVTVLGSTGSIGRSALSVIDAFPQQLEVSGLSARRQWEALADQAAQYQPRAVAVVDEGSAGHLRQRLSDAGVRCEVRTGVAGLEQLVRETDADFVLAAVVGSAGLPAVIAAVERGLTVGIANKEPLVVAGSLIVSRAAETGATLLPVDSEHSAVFQAMQAGRPDEVERIYLTASGGPFRTWSQEQMDEATLEDALKHPTWLMGPKITIDSATMMNKALEIIEARWLFDVDPDRIEVVVHPESIVHSMVEFRDGSIIAQLGTPDMRTPIQYALSFPNRWPARADRIDFKALGRMHFEAPDPQRFPALRLGHDVARRGGTAGAALNAANEAAVEAFQRNELRYREIVPLVEDVLYRHDFKADPTLDELLAVDAWARREVTECCRV